MFDDNLDMKTEEKKRGVKNESHVCDLYNQVKDGDIQ